MMGKFWVCVIITSFSFHMSLLFFFALLPSKSVPVPFPRFKIGLIIFILVLHFILRFCAARSNMPLWEFVFLPAFPIILHNSIARFYLHRCFTLHLILSILAVTSPYTSLWNLRKLYIYIYIYIKIHNPFSCKWILYV